MSSICSTTGTLYLPHSFQGSFFLEKPPETEGKRIRFFGKNDAWKELKRNQSLEQCVSHSEIEGPALNSRSKE